MPEHLNLTDSMMLANPCQLMGGIKWVDKRRLRDGVIIILIFILLQLSNLILQHSLGSSLSSAGDMVSFKDPEIFVTIKDISLILYFIVFLQTFPMSPQDYSINFGQ